VVESLQLILKTGILQTEIGKRSPNLALATRKHQTTQLPKKRRSVPPALLFTTLKQRVQLLTQLESLTASLQEETKANTIMWDVMKMDVVVATLILLGETIRELERIGMTIVKLITAQETIAVITGALSKGITKEAFRVGVVIGTTVYDTMYEVELAIEALEEDLRAKKEMKITSLLRKLVAATKITGTTSVETFAVTVEVTSDIMALGKETEGEQAKLIQSER
jgi:hypothetical protein